MAKLVRKMGRAPNQVRADALEGTAFPRFEELTANWKSWLPKVLFIAGLTLWIYWPALRGEFIWDDEWYITLNPLLLHADGLWKFWFQPGSWVEYYPVEETVLWLQWQLFGGSDTLGYHLTNLLLHFTSALLVWRLLSRFGLRFAWLGGLIFAIHPVQVDSVAYICELKNTLTLPFFLLAMLAWLDYDESRSKEDYQKALGLYLLAMLCKISAAPFAAIILLYAWWKRGRVDGRDVKDCAPFLVLAGVLAFMTLWTGRYYAEAGHFTQLQTKLDGILPRMDAIGLNATVYFARCFLPVDNMLVYPRWEVRPDELIQYLPWLVLAGIGFVLWKRRQSWGRHVALGLGFFLVMLSPFLGVPVVSYMDFSWVMDHLLYIPIIGLIGLVVAGMEGIDGQMSVRLRPVTIGLTAILIALMAWVSHSFAGLFVSAEVYWTHIVQRNPTAWLAHLNLNSRLLELGRYQEALVEGNEAMHLRPTRADIYYNQGFALEKLGRDAEAEAQYRKSLSLDPEQAKVYLILAEMLQNEKRAADAEALLRDGVKSLPDDAGVSVNLAGILSESGHKPEAIGLYQHVAELHPEMGQVQYNLGVALLQTGDLSGAVEHLQAAVTLEPNMTAAHKNLGVALAQLGHLPEAITQFQLVVDADPTDWKMRDNLGLALANSGRIMESLYQFQQALQLNPNDTMARTSLTKLQSVPLNTPTQH